MPMVSACIFGFPRWTAEASYSGGSYASGYGVANASGLPLSFVARTTDLQASSTQFVATLPRKRPLRMVGIVGHNLGIDAQMRVVVAGASGRVSGSEVSAVLTAALPTGFALTRAGIATYTAGDGTIQTNASGVARFDHNGQTGAPLGLLIEPSRDNIALYSNDLTNAVWSSVAGAVATASARSGPDGRVSLAQIAASAVASGGILRQAVNVQSQATTTLTLYAAAGAHQFVGFSLGSIGASAGTMTTFRFDTGVFAATPDNDATVSATRVRDDIWRLRLTGVTDSFVLVDASGNTIVDGDGNPIETAGIAALDIALPSSSGAAGWTPTAGLTIHAGFVQVETGDFPTTYIATTSAAVTRAADALTVTLNPTEYTIGQTTDSGTATTTVTVASATYPVMLPTGDTHLSLFTATPTRIVFDSAFFDVWPVVYASDDLQWEDDRFWTGKYTSTERAGYVWTRPVLLSTAVEGLAARIEFADPDNPDGYVQFGMAEFADGWQSSIQFAEGEFGFDERVEVVPAQNAKYFNRLDEPRTFAGIFPMLDRDEAMSFPFEMRRQLKTDIPFLWLPHPDETAHWLRTAYLARFVRPRPHAYAFPDYDSVPFSLEEVIE